MRVLALAEHDVFAYRTLRCLDALIGADVHLMTARGAGSLKLTTMRVRRATLRAPSFAADRHASLEIVADYVRRHGIEVVVPADPRTTRFAASNSAYGGIPWLPAPDRELFDSLNDKWRFAALCRQLGLPHPDTFRFRDRRDLQQMLTAHPGATFVGKPLDQEGGAGVQILCGGRSAAALDLPILLQKYVPGQDVSIATWCEAGKVVASASYTNRDNVFRFEPRPRLVELARRVAAHYRYTGFLCFDARVRQSDGALFLIECNPRGWYNSSTTMVAGLNLYDVALRRFSGEDVRPASIDTPVDVFTGRAALRALVDRRTRPNGVRALKYYARDPLLALWLDQNLARRFRAPAGHAGLRPAALGTHTRNPRRRRTAARPASDGRRMPDSAA